MMFYSELNKEIRQFLKRANMECWKKERCINGYYVEYYEERTYWVYDYEKETIMMIKAGSPYEAVEKVE